MSKGHFRTKWFNWKFLKHYLCCVQKSTFFQRVSPGFLAKNDHIYSRHFSLVYVPKDLGVS